MIRVLLTVLLSMGLVFALREWKDAAPRTKYTVWAGVGLLVFATVVIGYGNMLGA